jgi:hypothetical protein
MTNNVCGITTWVRGSSVSDPQGMYYFSFWELVSFCCSLLRPLLLASNLRNCQSCQWTSLSNRDSQKGNQIKHDRQKSLNFEHLFKSNALL